MPNVHRYENPAFCNSLLGLLEAAVKRTHVRVNIQVLVPKYGQCLTCPGLRWSTAQQPRRIFERSELGIGLLLYCKKRVRCVPVPSLRRISVSERQVAANCRR